MIPTRRLFFALWPGETLRTQIAVRTAAAIEHTPGRAMMPGNLHVTLAFIGSVSAQRLPVLIELGDRLRLSPCELVFDRLAIWKQARVMVLTASTVPQPLLQLVTELQIQLNAAGFRLDQRRYCPHVTLAREVRAAERSDCTAPVIWPASNFVLVESLSTAAGVQYQVLATFAS